MAAGHADQKRSGRSSSSSSSSSSRSRSRSRSTMRGYTVDTESGLDEKGSAVGSGLRSSNTTTRESVVQRLGSGIIISNNSDTTHGCTDSMDTAAGPDKNRSLAAPSRRGSSNRMRDIGSDEERSLLGISSSSSNNNRRSSSSRTMPGAGGCRWGSSSSSRLLASSPSTTTTTTTFLLLLIITTTIFSSFPSPCSAQGQEEIVHYKIQEETDVGSFVGNVARDSQLYSRFSQAEFSQLQYSVSTQGAKFVIDKLTSTIRTGQVLDRESECEFNSPSEPCELEFDVGVYQWEKTTELFDLLMIVHITVTVEDINDNSPVFPSKAVFLSVPESVPVNHVLLTSGAIDTDTGPSNNIQEYTLLPDNPAFRLQVMKSVDGMSSDLGIVVTQLLDRERQSTYNMQVVAKDGGFPQRSGSVNITVSVQDVNDNAPSFSRDVFNLTVREDSPVNVPIVRLAATDPDSAHNGDLTFAFSARTSQRIRSQFAVDSSTGDVILVKPLDFEKDKRLQFMVEVRDHGSPTQQAQAAVIVNVADVNDNAPQIDITLPPGGTNIAESIEVGSFIAHVSLSDADDGRNGEIACSITNRHFKLEKFSDFSYIYKILLQRGLDYEVDHQHVVNVSCADRGDPPLRNSSSFTIHVRDENDNAPVFSKPEYDINVRENMQPGLFVFQVIALDPDTANNGNITYSLLENPESAFSIDPLSGVLRAMKTFDRETRAGFRLTVQARDRGSPAMSSTATVRVEIDDVNDSPTHFAQQHFEFFMQEEQPKGSGVDTLGVVDLDDLAAGQLQFSFLPELRPPSEFRIDVYTGRITTTRPLDRESGDSVFDFKVFVVDAENVLFNDSATVTVTVTDINDHAPNISFPGKHNHTVRLPYTAPAGSIVTKVLASDQDLGKNGNAGIGYSVQGDSKAQDMFLMNGVTGELILTRRLSSSDVSTYRLQVSVQDSGQEVQMTTMATLDVVVTLSNSSGLFAGAGNPDHNVAIVVTLVCVTIALALAVLATICIIRRIDRERKHHSSAKVEEQNIYKQETLPPAPPMEKSPAMENYENEIEKLKRKIKRELSFVSDDETGPDSSSSMAMSKGTSSSFSTFKKTSSPGSTRDHKMISSPQASSSICLSPESTTGVKRVHYADKTREQLNRMADSPPPPHPRPTSPISPTGPSWSQQQHPRALSTGLTVRTEGEDAGSHTSGSTSDSGRGGSSEDDVHSHAGVCLGGESGGDDLRQQKQQQQHGGPPRGYLGNPSLSTFRSPNSGRPERSLLSSLGHHQPPHLSGSDLNTTLTATSPRSYLQAQGVGNGNGGGAGNHYSRNISFSDDSVTANTTVGGDSTLRHNSRSLLGHRTLGGGTTPQQERGGGGGGGGVGDEVSPRGILCHRDGPYRYGTQPSPASSSSSSSSHPRHHPQQQQHNSNNTPFTKSLPYRRSSSNNNQHQHPHQQQQQRHHQQQQHSPPLPLPPPDMSPLENRSGDDTYGVRGKTVNFSVAGDSFQMTPRRSSSTSTSSALGGIGGGGGGGGGDRGGGHNTTSSRGGSPVYVNRTMGQSSLGQAYASADMDDVLGDSSLGGGGSVGGPGGGEDEDRTTTTSGSYTINADDLCHEIDNLFFNDVVV